MYEPPRNEPQLLRTARNSRLFPKGGVGKLQKLLAAKKAAEANLAGNDLRRMRLEKEKRYNAFLELERNRSDAETLRVQGLRDANLDARVREMKTQLVQEREQMQAARSKASAPTPLEAPRTAPVTPQEMLMPPPAPPATPKAAPKFKIRKSPFKNPKPPPPKAAPVSTWPSATPNMYQVVPAKAPPPKAPAASKSPPKAAPQGPPRAATSSSSSSKAPPAEKKRP